MARTKDISSMDEIGMLAVRFFTSWRPENWVDKGTPGYEAARHIRLTVDRYKRHKRTPRNKK